MPEPHDDRCDTRQRRVPATPAPPAPCPDAEVGLSPLGMSLLALLREDERFRDIIDNPWGCADAGAPGTHAEAGPAAAGDA